MRCEGLFIRGALFLFIIAQESQSFALLVSYKFFKRYISQTLDTWLADFRAEITGEASAPLRLFISPIRSSHVKAYAFWEEKKQKKKRPFIDEAFATEQVWGRCCYVVLDDMCEYFQVDAIKYIMALPLINVSKIV